MSGQTVHDEGIRLGQCHHVGIDLVGTKRLTPDGAFFFLALLVPELSLPHLLAMLVEAHAKTGQAAEGLQVLTEAVDVMQRHGEQLFASWLFRLKGELLLALSPEHSTQAEQCFLDAIDTAQCSQAKSWELQATIRLSQLWHQQGKQKRARQALAEMYDWFDEGGDTADLCEAQALLTAWS